MSPIFFINRKSNRDALLISLGKENETAIRPILETVDWNPEAVQGLEDSVLNSPQTYFCFGENVSCLLLQKNNSFKGDFYVISRGYP